MTYISTAIKYQTKPLFLFHKLYMKSFQHIKHLYQL